MSELVDGALRKVAKGTVFVLVGTFVGMLLAFLARVVLVRNVTTAEYGLFSIAIAVIGIITVFSELGLQTGIIRNVAFFRGKQDTGRVLGVIFSSFQLSVIASLLLFALFFFLSNLLSVTVFHNPALAPVLKILLIVAPLTVLIDLLSAVFRSFNRLEGIFFNDFLLNVVKLAAFSLVLYLGWSFFGVLYAYLFSFAFIALLFAFYSIKKSPAFVDFTAKSVMLRKMLLFFSIPLLVQAIMGMIMEWADTLMIGYYMNAESVGVYNMVMPLSKMVSLFLVALVFFYVPIASELFAKDLFSELRRVYAVLTKWVFSFTLPVFLLFFLFPNAILQIIFNTTSNEAAIVLRILSAGFLLHALMGPTASTLVVLGQTKSIMNFSIVAAVINVVLNVALIPVIGISGAAIASAASFVFMNLSYFAILLLKYKIQPFTANYLRPVAFSALIITVIYFLTKSLFVVPPLWFIIVMFVAFLAIYGLSLLLTKSFDKEDVMMLLSIEKQLGINLSFFKNLLKRFV